MRVALLFFLLLGCGHAQEALRASLRAIAADAKGKVYVACSLPGTSLNCDLEPAGHPPMQSVFKLPVAMTMLHAVDQGRFTLDQPIHIAKSDLMPGTHSPLQDAHPQGDVDIPLRDILRATVSESDNVGADIVLRLVGGPPAVQSYLSTLGIDNIRVRDGEHGLGKDVSVQYRNWAEPRGMIALLRRLADHSPLAPPTAAFLEDIMAHGGTGVHRLRALLPPGTVLEHKTGTSGTEHGLAPATNDVGLIVLPDGRRVALAVFVTDSRADEATREGVIARIGRAVYDAAVQTKP